MAVSERKEVETHADSRPPSFFWCGGGARVSERSKEWLKSEEGRRCIHQAAHETDHLILFLKHH